MFAVFHIGVLLELGPEHVSEGDALGALWMKEGGGRGGRRVREGGMVSFLGAGSEHSDGMLTLLAIWSATRRQSRYNCVGCGEREGGEHESL